MIKQPYFVSSPFSLVNIYVRTPAQGAAKPVKAGVFRVFTLYQLSLQGSVVKKCRRFCVNLCNPWFRLVPRG